MNEWQQFQVRRRARAVFSESSVLMAAVGWYTPALRNKHSCYQLQLVVPRQRQNKGFNDHNSSIPDVHRFFIRTSKVRFRLAVFKFSKIFRLNRSSFVLKLVACTAFRNT